LIQAEGGGTAFQVKASDGSPITVRMKSPIPDSLVGLVEVYGIGQGRNLVLADKITVFPEHMASSFGEVYIVLVVYAARRFLDFYDIYKN